MSMTMGDSTYLPIHSTGLFDPNPSHNTTANRRQDNCSPSAIILHPFRTFAWNGRVILAVFAIQIVQLYVRIAFRLAELDGDGKQVYGSMVAKIVRFLAQLEDWGWVLYIGISLWIVAVYRRRRLLSFMYLVGNVDLGLLLGRALVMMLLGGYGSIADPIRRFFSPFIYQCSFWCFLLVGVHCSKTQAGVTLFLHVPHDGIFFTLEYHYGSLMSMLEPNSDQLQVLKKPGCSGKLIPKVRDISARKKVKTGNDVSRTTDHRLWSDVVKTTSKQHLEQEV
jgi:hypothetical protein